MEKVRLDENKMYEYTELLKVIRETVPEERIEEVCLNSQTLKTLAGYTEQSTDENFNEYIKNYVDKLSYDKHNRKVEIAKKNKDQEELKRLSDEAMEMAGYKGCPKKLINSFTKSFVDRTLLEKEKKRMYKALQAEDAKAVEEAYRRIFDMSSYSDNPTYCVTNEYADTFVDNGIDKFIRIGINIQRDNRDNIYYAM